MNTNEELIKHFYTSFQQKDAKAMQECYADNATFSDPIFSSLNSAQVRAMWAMLLKSGQDMRIEFHNIQSKSNSASAEWDAYYTFSATGNKVINKVKANFVIENGKIVQHQDTFSFYRWARQALGFTGLVLGWTSLLQNKVSKKAKKNLELFMNSSS